MQFISYAQNFEDVMLYRSLRSVERGFYIDVGAWDPVADSVTKAFYDRGWLGINIEPIAELCAKFEKERPRDINLAVAAGDREGKTELHILEPSGLSTTSRTILRDHAKSGKQYKTEEVVQETLASICSRYVMSDIHFLKIDAEGAERAILEGMDLKNFRPWIIVVEATEPGTPTQNHDQWESITLKAGYHHVYFDGLNRFYVAAEHAHLTENFNSPPNVFDDFIRHSEVLSSKAVSVLNDEKNQLNDEKNQLELEVSALSHEGDQLREELMQLQKKYKIPIMVHQRIASLWRRFDKST